MTSVCFLQENKATSKSVYNTMAQQFETLYNQLYEVRSPEHCKVTDASGIHICTAIPGCTAEFYGDGHPVTLSSDAAVLREINFRITPQPWKVHAIDGAEANLSLQHRMIYRAEELKSLVLNDSDAVSDFFCEICFTSGNVPTALIVPASWKWSGEDVSNAAFVPQSNTRYRLVVLSDGAFVRAAAEGVSI